ncbi:helix-turn-helix transcriptional regulator [Alcanivorax sp. 24]|uniref:helix-turn-helix transcriptional regulator n=1 Tax=Alcanivorax sp. 24 TaxID=2545266 RepID=UPI00105BF085|nr:helix-turn-helix transcriptional regulator [Alcanivorax sp. 24]
MHPANDQNESNGPDYMVTIGDRVRAIRARRGMARKELSSQSDISERYLAQIEGGKANISIMLLQRLAAAMGVPVQDILPQPEQQQVLSPPLRDLLDRLSPAQLDEAYQLLVRHFDVNKGQHRGVALIGLRGGGKSRLGQMLGERLNVPYIRLNGLIEQLAGMDIGEIMALGGQPAYRRFEREALEYVIEQDPLSVVEAGGSLVSEAETFQRLLSRFHTVWIKASPEEHMQRVIDQGDTRPMQGHTHAMDDLKRILVERDADYRRADAVLDTSHRSVEDSFAELLSMTRPYLTGPTAVNQ